VDGGDTPLAEEHTRNVLNVLMPDDDDDKERHLLTRLEYQKDSSDLTEPSFSLEDYASAVENISPKKAPGPDNVNGIVIKKLSDVLEQSLLN
jgi:hypothetical protein